jgi:hypothetical protein
MMGSHASTAEISQVNPRDSIFEAFADPQSYELPSSFHSLTLMQESSTRLSVGFHLPLADRIMGDLTTTDRPTTDLRVLGLQSTK